MASGRSASARVSPVFAPSMTPCARNIVCPDFRIALFGRIDNDALKHVERADEGRDEAGARAVIDVAGAADLLDRASSFITTIRSEIDSASSWSWVTKPWW